MREWPAHVLRTIEEVKAASHLYYVCLHGPRLGKARLTEDGLIDGFNNTKSDLHPYSFNIGRNFVGERDFLFDNYWHAWACLNSWREDDK